MKKTFCDFCEGPGAIDKGLRIQVSDYDICDGCIQKIFKALAQGGE